MRLGIPAFARLFAGKTTAATAAVFPVEVTITEVNDARLAVREGDLFTGEIASDPDVLAAVGVAAVDDVTLDVGGVRLTDERAEPGLSLIDLGGGDLGLAMTVNDVQGVFGFAGTLDFLGTGANAVAFVDDTGTVVGGDFAVVPVPAALPLLATGVAALAWMRRRRS
jgi:hypothetical protein